MKLRDNPNNNMKISTEKYNELRELAKIAYPLNPDDWDSARTIEAENRFFDKLAPILSLAEWEKLEAYCLKATNEERIAAGLGYLEMHMHKTAPLWEKEFGIEFRVPAEIAENPDLQDLSWHNDLCPSFCLAQAEATEDLVRIWVNHIDPKERELESLPRFVVVADNDWDNDAAFETDNIEKAIAKLKEKSKRL